jgi:hypothetical protein
MKTKLIKSKGRSRPLTAKQECLFFAATLGAGALLQLAAALKFIAIMP